MVWIFGIPLWKGFWLRGTRFESQPPGPQTTNLPLAVCWTWDVHSPWIPIKKWSFKGYPFFPPVFFWKAFSLHRWRRPSCMGHVLVGKSRLMQKCIPLTKSASFGMVLYFMTSVGWFMTSVGWFMTSVGWFFTQCWVLFLNILFTISADVEQTKNWVLTQNKFDSNLHFLKVEWSKGGYVFADFLPLRFLGSLRCLLQKVLKMHNLLQTCFFTKATADLQNSMRSFGAVFLG